MISKETMMTIFTAANALANKRDHKVYSIEFAIRQRKDKASNTKSASARTRALNEVEVLEAELKEAQRLAKEVHDAIQELRSTDIGAEVWEGV